MQSRCSYSGIWKVAYPLIIMNAGLTIMHFCDRKFLAMNSPQEVAAALPAGVLSFTLTSFFLALSSYTATVVAQYFGKGDSASCVKAAWNGFYLSLGSGLLVLFVMPWLGLGLIEFSGHAPEIRAMERDYFITLIPSGAFMCMSAALISLFSGVGRTRHAAFVNLTACSLNVVLDYMLIFGKWGAPAMGIRGAGIATSVSAACTFLLAALLFWFQDQARYPTRSQRVFSWVEIRRLFRFGSPAGLQIFSDVGAFTAFTFLIGLISQEAMVVATIVLTINHLAFNPMMGLADATAILTGQFMGARHPNLVYRLVFRAWFMAIIYMGLMALFYLLLPGWLLNQFAPQNYNGSISFDRVVEQGRYLLLFVLVYNFFDATKFVIMGLLRGAGDTRACVVITTLCAWGLMIPGMAILIFHFKVGIIGVWLYCSCCAFLEASTYYWRFKTEKWKKIKVIDHFQESAESSIAKEII